MGAAVHFAHDLCGDPADSLKASDWRRRLLRAGLLIAWSVLVVIGLILLGKRVGQTWYFEPTAEALEGARVGDLLIFAGSVTILAAAGLARKMRTPTWACVLVAVPAFLIGGLTLLVGESLLPQLAALVALPVGLAGLISTLILAKPLTMLVRGSRITFTDLQQRQ